MTSRICGAGQDSFEICFSYLSSEKKIDFRIRTGYPKKASLIKLLSGPESLSWVKVIDLGVLGLLR